ncbi:MAG: EndoU domain-containing protein, partial [Gammaproteobacteria bacterium]|nr:EndoU domain-containing protein [Gammaproteobacteria bacterium]
MRIMPTSAVFLLYGFIGSAHAADGIQCMFLPAWSEPVQGYSVNLHHVFCGESGKKQRAKGFHSMPGGKAPSTYVKSNPGAAPNAAGVYTLKRIELVFNGKNYVKSFSS